MSEDLKEHVDVSLKIKEEFKDDFDECRIICDEAEVINEQSRIQEAPIARSFREDAKILTETERKTQYASGKLAIMS